jgi:hypothetical protein
VIFAVQTIWVPHTWLAEKYQQSKQTFSAHPQVRQGGACLHSIQRHDGVASQVKRSQAREPVAEAINTSEAVVAKIKLFQKWQVPNAIADAK